MKLRTHKKLASYFICAFVFGTVGLVALYFNQEKLLFFPEKIPESYQFHFQQPFRESKLTLASGETVDYLIFNPNSKKGVILYFHGNAGSLRDWGYVANDIASKTGWSIWIMDYPGFGKNSGSLPKTEKLLIEMGRAFRNAISHENKDLPFVIFGRSLGSGIATILASEKAPDGLILETPYRSIARLGHEIYPFLPEAFSRFDLNSEKTLPKVDSKTAILILHGTQDRVIPFAHGEILSTLKLQAQFVAFQGGDHNNLSSFPSYWPTVERFFSGLSKQ